MSTQDPSPDTRPSPEELAANAHPVGAPQKDAFGPVRRANPLLNKTLMTSIGIVVLVLILVKAGIFATIFHLGVQTVAPSTEGTATPPPHANAAGGIIESANNSTPGPEGGGSGTSPSVRPTTLTPEQQEAMQEHLQQGGAGLDATSNVNQPLATNLAATSLPSPTPEPAAAPPAAPATAQVPAPTEQGADSILIASTTSQASQTEFGSPAIPVPAASGASSNVQTPGQLRDNASLEFMSSASGAHYLQSSEEPPVGPIEIFPGTPIHARLTSGIDTTHPGYVWAEITQPVRNSLPPHQIIFPVTGTMRGRVDGDVIQGQSSVTVSWDLITLPNGWIFDLGNMQGSEPGSTNGISGSVNNHVGRTYTTVFLWPLLTGATAALNPGSNSLTPSAGASAASAAAAGLANAANAQLQQNLAIPPSIVVQPGKDFIIRVESTIVNVRPYVDIAPESSGQKPAQIVDPTPTP